MRRTCRIVAVAAAAVQLAAALAAATASVPGRADAVEPERLRLVLPGPPATEYSSRQRPSPEDRDVAAALAAAAPDLAFSPGLARAARIYASAVDETLRDRVPEGFLDFALRAAGCPDPAPAVALVFSTDDDIGEMLSRLAGLRASMPAPPTLVGAARVADAGSRLRWRWAVVMARREAVVEPFPRSLRPGRSWPLEFTLEGDLERPSVVVLRPGGETVRVTPQLRTGRWVAGVSVGAHAGEGTVEIVAEGASGPRIVALMPVCVGVPPARAWEGPPVRPAAPPAGPEEAEREMAAMLDADRLRHGLSPLAPSPELAAIARAHSEDMRDNGFVGHRSPTSGVLRDRLRAAGFAFREAAENISRASSLAAARASLMASPAHRDAILSKRFTTVGIGVALATGADGPAVWVTEVFALPVVPPAPGRVDASMATRLGARRTGPRRDPVLDAVASSLARREVAPASSDELRRAAQEALEAAGVKWHELFVETQRFATEDAATPPAFASRDDITRFGLAVVPAGDREVVLVALGIR